MNLGPFAVSIMWMPLNPAVWDAVPFYERSEYPPRVVHEIYLLFVRVTLIDNRRVWMAPAPTGYAFVRDGDIQQGDVMLDGATGRWREVPASVVGQRASTLLGVARKGREV